ncbi:hypothetical protein DUI87_31503 [Hirundo rustica rustica]|uniref:Uncharacterized protein n=1 Tax=Hirundo rustica rustica TaxID=333673 RepID=A0A3M0IT15_HIRRU|nr:hypothetical protein DUI87_31503 [Hirundo rustica rustica]
MAAFNGLVLWLDVTLVPGMKCSVDIDQPWDQEKRREEKRREEKRREEKKRRERREEKREERREREENGILW